MPQLTNDAIQLRRSGSPRHNHAVPNSTPGAFDGILQDAAHHHAGNFEFSRREEREHARDRIEDNCHFAARNVNLPCSRIPRQH
jgi:hypothetical protein